MQSYLRQMATMKTVGMGALYFFASHMVIRTLFYVGVGREAQEIITFFLLLLGSVAVVHIVPSTFLNLRARVGEYLRAPLVSTLAAAGSFLLLLSILPEMGTIPLYLGGILVGLACGMLVVTWTSSFHLGAPDAHTYSVPPELAWAVLFYFIFRAASTVSPMVSDGVLFTLPLLAIAYLSGDRQDETSYDDVEPGAENSRASLVLVYVSALFAVLSMVVVHLSGKDGLYLDSSLNHMVLFEVLMVAAVFGGCSSIRWLAAQPTHPRHIAPFATAVLCMPGLLIGVSMGAAYVPDGAANLMWETSFWVMLVAVFAYDMRWSPYLCDGLAVGLMFEAMCVAQLSTQLVLHLDAPWWAAALSVGIALAYFAGTLRQLLGGRDVGSNRLGSDTGACGAETAPEDAVAEDKSNDREDIDAGNTYMNESGHASTDNDLRLRQLATDYGLTPAETTVFELMAHGRSARYLSDELGISFNTARTHIRHVYEKLGIHSKQDLIDLAEVSAG